VDGAESVAQGGFGTPRSQERRADGGRHGTGTGSGAASIITALRRGGWLV
jgi:hypothetical protein